LRFVLAFWVILHHLAGRNMLLAKTIDMLPGPVSTLIHGGYLAVQTFFLLSGFVLARSYAQVNWNKTSWKKFCAARFARIYPVYLLSLCIVLKFIVETMFSGSRTAGQKAGYLIDYAFLLQGWKPNPQVGWNTPAWSLSCEFFFYLCFPVLFAVLRNARWRTIAVSLAICIAMPIMLTHSGLPEYLKPLYHLADFAAGIATARILVLFEDRNRGMSRGAWLYWPAAAVALWFILHPRVLWAFRVDLNTVLRPLNVLLLLGFALSGGWLARLLSTQRVEYLGKASYAMYILHIPILWWFGRGVVHGGLNITGVPAGILYLATVMAASVLAYEFVEIPVNRWIRGFVSGRDEAQAPSYEFAVTS
jgi:peptidoglycan/LPS O-acetylase OafA/YrhL